jgi:hypothetical protein
MITENQAAIKPKTQRRRLFLIKMFRLCISGIGRKFLLPHAVRPPPPLDFTARFY